MSTDWSLPSSSGSRRSRSSGRRQQRGQPDEEDEGGGVAGVVRRAGEAAAGVGAGTAAAGLEEAGRAVAGVAAAAAAAPAGSVLQDVAGAAAATTAEAAAELKVRHVWFEGHDSAGPDKHFLVSVPVLDALSEGSDVLLALHMNGEPLPSYHGYPVRVVVRGHVGVRSCKWLRRIVLAPEEAPSHYQQSDYKMLPPFVDSQLKADWAAVPAMQLLPVQSAICVPAVGQVCEVGADGCIGVEGYAWSGGGVGVIRVEVTADGSDSWTPAELRGAEGLQAGVMVCQVVGTVCWQQRWCLAGRETAGGCRLGPFGVPGCLSGLDLQKLPLLPLAKPPSARTAAAAAAGV